MNLKLLMLNMLAVLTQAQVNIKTNLISTIPLNHSMVFEVKIQKGKIGNFSRFQLDVPPGVGIGQVESRSGNFSFGENRAKIIWVTTPAEEEFTLRMKLLPVSSPGKGSFKFTYFYVEDNQKKEFHGRELVVNFKDTVMPVLLSSHMTDLDPRKSGNEGAVHSGNKSQVDNSIDLEAKVKRLRRESSEGKLIGQKEKKNAEARLKSIREEQQKAGGDSGAEAARLRKERQQAEQDLATAEKILSLSRKLEKEADEIERIGKGLDAQDGDQRPAKGRKPDPASPETEYRVQVGSFSQKPSPVRFRKYGKVHINYEAPLYKVYLGAYTDKAEAYILRDRLITDFPGCFVATFRKGEREN